jgi:Replication-relaxation
MKVKRAPQTPTDVQPLTPTDEEILRTLSTYRYMTALDVAYSLFSPNSLSHVRRLLAALAGGRDYQERQFLYRFPLPSAKAGNRERVYTLGAAGREVVESLGVPVEWYYRPSKVGRLSHSHLAHQLLLTRFVVAACSWASKEPEYRLADVWLSYDIAKSMASLAGEHGRRAAAVIPDGWLQFERVADGAHVPILVEIDRGSEYQERFKNHIRARLEFIRSGDYERVFDTPAVIIAYATTGQVQAYADTRRKTMGAWTMEVLAELEIESWASVFRVTTVTYETLYEDAQALFTAPVWYRPDSPTPVRLIAPSHCTVVYSNSADNSITSKTG